MAYPNCFTFEVELESKAEGLRIAGILSVPSQMALVSTCKPNKKYHTTVFEVETALSLEDFLAYLLKHNVRPVTPIIPVRQQIQI
jgi:hypothetical protein